LREVVEEIFMLVVFLVVVVAILVSVALRFMVSCLFSLEVLARGYGGGM
jgi:hypothetical protein